MKISTRLLGFVVAAALICALAAGAAMAADDAAQGRGIATKWSPAIVKIQIVVKIGMSFMGQGETRENKQEVTGVVIDPSGLTLVSLAETNPADVLGGMFGDGGDNTPSMTSEVTDVKIRLTDGKEIAGKVVLRDKDLDLAFIRPAEKLAQPLTCIDLKDSAQVDVLDQTVIVGRMGKIANRALSASLTRIQAVVEKPRRFYTIGISGPGGDLGSPVFTMDGKLVGVLLLRAMPGKGGGGSSESPVMPVIIPADDIVPVAAQAPEDAPKEVAKETPKEPAKPAVPAKPVAPAKPPVKK